MLAVPDHSQLFDAVGYETEIIEHVDPRYLGKIQKLFNVLQMKSEEVGIDGCIDLFDEYASDASPFL